MSEKMTFEEAIKRLEKIVERLEEGDIPLEEALGMYKEGMDYSKLCHDKLRNAEKELTKILTEDGEEDFQLEEEAD